MENKIGYVVISTEEYKNTIKNEFYIDDLNSEIIEMKKQMLEINEKIATYIHGHSQFEIDRLEVGEDGKIKETYYYVQLVDFFNKLGVEDKHFIDTMIQHFYENRENK